MNISRANFGRLVLGAPLLVACGGAEDGSEEQTSAQAQPLVHPIGTEYLDIKKFAYSSQGLMSMMLSEFIGPLWLAAISVQRVSPEVVVGQIWKGELGAYGRANLQVGPTKYDELFAILTTPGAHAVQLMYDGETLAPLDIIVS